MNETTGTDLAAPPARGEGLPRRAAALVYRHRWTGLLASGVLASLVLGAMLAGGGQQGFLHPDGVDEEGSRALARLLADRGVEVVQTTSSVRAVEAAGRDATLLVTDPSLVPPARRRAVAAAGATVVLVQPRGRALAELAPQLLPVDIRPVRTLDSGCGLGAAVGAGRATLGGQRYRGRPGQPHTLCYPTPGQPGRAPLAAVQVGEREVVAVGTAQIFQNRQLATEGNAALALRLLGEHPRLVWYRPDQNELTGGPRPSSLYDLLPAPWRWAAAQLWIAALLLALWRFRRFGPVLVEPLPVVVRAAETIEGRARLYRGARAAGHAAATLRAAVLSRLLPLLGMAAGTEPPAVVAAVATRTGRPAPLVEAVLYGTGPRSPAAGAGTADAEQTLPSWLTEADWAALGVPGTRGRRRGTDGDLVRLAECLRVLEREVRRS